MSSRDKYGKVIFILPNNKQIQSKEPNKRLNKAMQKLSNSLDRSFKKFEMDKYFKSIEE